MIQPAVFLFTAMSLAPDRDENVEERVIETETREVSRVEPGGLAIQIRPVRDELHVTLKRDHTCIDETVESRTVERFRRAPEAVPAGLALGGVGLLALLGAGGAVALAPQQPSVNDEFSRGELSREAVSGIGAVSALLGAVGVGGGVAFAVLGREEVFGEEVIEAIVSTRKRPCPERVSNATMQLLVWNGHELRGRLVDDVTIYDVPDDVFDIPPVGTAWATLDAVVGDRRVSTKWDPPAASFADNLASSGDLSDLEKFRDRFASAKEWAQLEWRYQQLIAARDAEAEAKKSHDAELRRQRAEALIGEAAAALAAKSYADALVKVEAAERAGVDAGDVGRQVRKAAQTHGKNRDRARGCPCQAWRR